MPGDPLRSFTLTRHARRLPTALLAGLLTLPASAALNHHAPAAEATASAHPAGSVIRFGLAQLGTPYEWGATGPSSYDCSGFTQAAYRSAGITLPRTSRMQYTYGPKIAHRYWKPGDLIFFASDPAYPSTIHHVAIYMGSGIMMDAPHAGTVVQVRKIYTSGLLPYATRPAGITAHPLFNTMPYTSSADVLAVQTRLRANGYPVKVTGYYDATTVTAVKQVQAGSALFVSGIVGGMTWDQLVWHGEQTRPS